MKKKKEKEGYELVREKVDTILKNKKLEVFISKNVISIGKELAFKGYLLTDSKVRLEFYIPVDELYKK